MRYLLDTNIFLYIATDPDLLSVDVHSLLDDPDAVWCMSTVSLQELVIGYNNKSFDVKHWKSAEELIKAVTDEYFIQVLLIKPEHIHTYARLRPNAAKGHKDPFDHLIISHAITEGLPLISSDERFPFYTRQGLDLIFNEK